jgi:hypothetical protein
MLESRMSQASIGVAKAVPFPVDFKERHHDRIFKQVSFPGENGTYRLRTINAGLRTESTVVQKHVNLNIPMDSVDGQLFRVKAVLNTPIHGVEESYWLTLHHTDYTDVVQPLNQYRIRGVSNEGWKSDWVYSELRNDRNELLVYEMLYDLLDILTTVRDGEIETLLSLFAEDAFKSYMVKDERIMYFAELTAAERLDHQIQERTETEGNRRFDFSEDVVTKMHELFATIGKLLGYEFKESFMASPKEFSEILKMYRLKDRFMKNPGEMVSMIVEVFLQEYLDKIVRRASIEVLAENGENKEIYLEGNYDLDVKGELLRSAYHIMPHDNFVMSANGTVQLIIGPVVWETVDYGYLESAIEDLKFFKKEITEILTTEPSEQISMFMRLFVEEGFFPYLLADQRLAQLSIDLSDEVQKLNAKNDNIVEYDLYGYDYNNRFMFIFDIARNLIRGDGSHYEDYFVSLLDHLARRMTEEKHILLDYCFSEFIEVLAEMGERIEAGYKKINRAYSDSVMVEANELTPSMEDMINPLVQSEATSVFIEDQYRVVPAAESFIYDKLDLLFGEQHHTSSTPSVNAYDLFSFASFETHEMRNTLRNSLSEYYSLLPVERTGYRLKDKHQFSESLNVDLMDGLYPNYLPQLKDPYARSIQEAKDIKILPDLKDKYVIPGRERVQYALGDGFDKGWPLGTFKLGVNTLKGVST